MQKQKKYSQSKVFEFKPTQEVSPQELVELLALIRIGVSGEILEKASDELNKHFIEIKK